QKNKCISDNTSGNDFLYAFFDRINRGKTNQSLRTANFQHHVITRVNARRAVHAFELGTVADVDACWANVNAQFAVDTISTGFRLVLAQLCPRLTAQPVVRHDDRLPRQQHTQQSAVRTHRYTRLLPKACKHSVKDSGKCNKSKESRQVIRW